MPGPNNARVLHTQQTHYFRKRVNFGDVGVGTGVYMGTLPTGAMVIDGVARVNVVFNAATTNVLTCGTNSPNYDNIIGAADINEAVLGGYRAAVLTAAAGIYAVDTDIYARYTQTGAAATTGQADLIVEYCPNNDG